MTLVSTPFDGSPANPVDQLENLVAANEWPFERIGDDEIAFSIGGEHTQYHLWFGWRPDASALEFRCAFDLNLPERRFTDICEVVTRINDQLWLGHFDAAPTDSSVTFRHTTIVADGVGLAPAQLEMIVEIALASCDRAYPAFMLLLWGGKRPADAVAFAMLETVGEA